MSKRYERFLSAFFCVFLGGLLAWHLVLPDRDRSETENRLLEQMPAFSWKALADGSFTEDVEKYFADQFPLRDQWTGLKARMEQALGKREFHGVYLCGQRLISRVEAPADGLEIRNLEYVSRFAEQAGIPVYLGLIPSAADICKDELPKGAESWDQAAYLETAKETEEIAGSIDFRTPLTDHKNEPIFYRTDHHWTTLGAFYGANAILEALNKPPLQITDYTPETASTSFQGTLYSTSGVHWLAPEPIEYWVPEGTITVTSWRTGEPEESPLYDRSYLTKKDKYSSFLGGNQPLCVLKNPTAEGRILLIRDSYSDALAPFLSQRFAEVHLLDPRYYRLSPTEYAQENSIDTALVLLSIPNFIADRNLVLLTR
ncbi:MAG: hypothetical protein HFF90_01510 [Oscillibacter sp.]|nr:hypothetical protein [Oscillibacter sp.]